jgi:Ca2+-binding RTX toxin-like protein
MRNINNVIDYARMAQDAYNEFNWPNAAESAYDSTGKTNVKSENTTIKRIFINKYSGNINVSAYKKDVFDNNNVCLSSELVVSFGGTNGGKDFLSDTSLGFPFFNDIGNKIKYDIEDIIPFCFNKKSAEEIKITSVGHSLGGCYAELFAASFYGSEKYQSDKKVDVFTFNGLGCISGMNQYLKDGLAANKTKENPDADKNEKDKKEIIYDGVHSGGNDRNHLLPLVYDRNKVGVAEHYSNEKDPVSGISNHISGEEYVTMTDNFFLNLTGNHSISGLIADLEKTETPPVLRGYNGIEPLEYLSYFNGALSAGDVMRGFEDNLGGSRSDNKYTGNDKNSFFEGYIGNDILIGGGGNDFLSGGIGRDVLADSEEDISKMESLSLRADSSNKYVGGKDDDTIIDTAGNDTIFYNKGDGHDLIVLGETLRDSDKVIFGEDIKPGDLSFTVSGDKMVMHIAKGKDKEGSLTFDNWFTSKETSAQKVELFLFKDGTELTWQQISEMATMNVKLGTEKYDKIYGSDNVKNVIYGLDGDDIIYGGNSNDVLYGGNGNDQLGDDGDYSTRTANTYIGGSGNDTIRDTKGDDTIIYNTGDGNDTINMGYSVDNDKIVFSSDISVSDLSYKIIEKDLLILINKKEKSGSIRFKEWFTKPNDSIYKIENFVFNDGKTIMSWNEVMTQAELMHLLSDNNNNKLTGLDWRNNTINGLEGNDELKGGSKDDKINGGDGDDIINGSHGNDTLIGGKGNDIISDSHGRDEIHYSPGDGEDEIAVNVTSTDDKADDKLIFSNGINMSNVSFHAENKDLKIVINNNYSDSGSVTVKNWFNYPAHGYNKLETISFTDGKELSWKNVNEIVESTSNIGTDGDDEIQGMHWKNNVIYGLAGNDIITGLGFKNEIHGGSGNDFIIGSDAGRNVIYGDDGNDIIHGGYNGADIFGGRGDDIIFVGRVGADIHYEIGDGNDVINPYGGNGKLIFGNGIHFSDLSYDADYGKDGENSSLTLNVSGGGKIKLNNWFKEPNTSDRKISYYKFEADGKEIYFMDLIHQLNLVKWEKEKAQASKLTKQYDLLSQEMAASDADAEPTVDYNKQNQDLYAYIEH